MKKKNNNIREFLNFDNPIPNEEDIKRVIETIEKKLSAKEMNQQRNYAIKEGYTRAIENLKKRVNNIEGLRTVQGRAIASIAYDYLEGLCSEKVLCGIQIKTI